MSRNFGLGSKPDKCRLSTVQFHIPLCILTICVVGVGLSYLFWGL